MPKWLRGLKSYANIVGELLGDWPETMEAEAPVVLVVDRYDPSWESREAFLKRVQEELRRQADAVEEAFESQGMERQGGKSELETHVEWLYERIALKKPPMKIALDNDMGQSTVEGAIGELAKDLQITLPRNRGPSIRRRQP